MLYVGRRHSISINKIAIASDAFVLCERICKIAYICYAHKCACCELNRKVYVYRA